MGSTPPHRRLLGLVEVRGVGAVEYPNDGRNVGEMEVPVRTEALYNKDQSGSAYTTHQYEPFLLPYQ